MPNEILQNGLNPSIGYLHSWQTTDFSADIAEVFKPVDYR